MCSNTIIRGSATFWVKWIKMSIKIWSDRTGSPGTSGLGLGRGLSAIALAASRVISTNSASKPWRTDASCTEHVSSCGHDILKKRYFLSWNRPCSRDLRTFSSVHWYSCTVGSYTPPILLQLHAWCESLLALEWEEDGINTNCQRKFNPVDVDDVQTTTGSKLN